MIYSASTRAKQSYWFAQLRNGLQNMAHTAKVIVRIGLGIVIGILAMTKAWAKADFSLADPSVREHLITANSLSSENYSVSINLATQALTYGKKHNNIASQCYAHIVLAQRFEKAGELKQATEHYGKAAALVHDYDQLKKDPNLQYFISDGLILSDRFDESLELILRGLAIKRNTGDKEYLMNAHSIQSRNYSGKKDYANAIESSQLALQLAKELGQEDIIISSYRKIALSYKNLGDNNSALKYNSYVLDILENKNSNNRIANYLNIDQKSTLEKGKEELANLMQAYDLHSSLLYGKKKYQASIDSSNKALNIASQLRSEEFIVRSYRKIAQASKKLGDYTSSLKFNQKALEMVKLNGDERDIAQHLEYISTDQRVLGLYSSALENAKLALEVQRKYEDTYRISNLLLNISIIYLKLSSYDQSLTYALEFLSLHEESNDANRIASANNQVGRIFSRLERYEDAAEYHLRTLSLDATKVKSTYRASALRSLAEIKLGTNDYPAALEHANEAKRLYKKIKDLRGVATADYITAEIYSNMGEFVKAVEHQQNALTLANKLDDKWAEARSLIHMGATLAKYNSGRARESLDRGLELAKELKAKSLQLDAYRSLMTIERKNANLEKAIEHYDVVYKLVREIDSEEVDDRIAELRILQETEKNERQIENLKRTMLISKLELSKQSAELEVLNSKNTIAVLQIEKEQQKLFILVAITILIGLVLALVYMRYRFLKESQQYLNDRNTEVEKKNANLAELNLTKDRFFSIISHDLRTPIAAIVARADMLNEHYDQLNADKIKSYIAEIYTASDQTFGMLENLLSWAIIQLRNADPLREEFKALELCNNVIEQFSQAIDSKSLVIECNVNSTDSIYADINMISAVLRNLIANAIKFTPRNGRITISSEPIDTSLRLHVHDTGVGVGEEDQKNLFSLDKLVSHKGTDGESGTGFGLAMSKDLIQKNQGELAVNSILNEGSDFYFTLPCKKTHRQNT